jgi:hypothetical protein
LIAVVPIEIAMEKGATEIYAINVSYAGDPQPPVRGVWNITQRSITTLIYQQLVDDLEEAAEAGDALDLHHISIQSYAGLPLTDFDHMAEMVDEGRRATEAYLADPRPTSRPVAGPPMSATADAAPPGARVYVPGKYRQPQGR